MDSSDAAGVTQWLPIALTIAGSDSGGGAGIQADLKTFAALGVYGASVVTALTAQNTRTVRRISFSSPEMVADQIDLVLEDFNVAAIKIGMLGRAEIAQVVAERLPSLLGRGVRGEGGHTSGPGPHPADYSPSRHGRPMVGHLFPEGEGRRAFVIYDPVMSASSGDRLSGASFAESVRSSLLPSVDCLTPNLAEAAALLGEAPARSEADMVRQGEALLKLGPRAVLMKGGHLEGREAVDLLVTEETVHRFAAPRLASQNLHGTGCTLSSAIAANIVLGAPLPEAVAAAKAFVSQSIERGQDVTLGAGAGPLIQTELRSKL
jgi:hydroxymethylpyrimidine/phosphomethylpyrimidine kinase